MSLVLKIMSILIRENETNTDAAARSPEEPDFVRLAMQYISQNFDKNLRIHDIAAELGVSRSYLSSCFRKSVGCSPQTFILNLRMERAGSLLRTTTLPVNIISAAVGYQDQLAFSKIFKQFYGVSPRDFRKSGQEVKVFGKKGDFIYQGL
jgi:YesN/AraC family two-component response regulator